MLTKNLRLIVGFSTIVATITGVYLFAPDHAIDKASAVAGVTVTGGTFTGGIDWATQVTGKPTTIAGYGITDVYAWAQAATKPSYAFTEITGSVTDAQVPNNITISTTTGTFSGAVTWLSGSSTNANTAYTHSQSTHVGLTGLNASGTWGINVTGSAASATTATTATNATYLYSTSHPGTYYISNAWDGTYWQLTSNHGAAVNVGRATTAGTATALAANGSNCTSNQFPLGIDASGNVESCSNVVTNSVNVIAGGSVSTGALSATTGTFTSTLVQGGGYAYLGSYNTGGTTYPTSGTSLAAGWNFATGTGSIDLFNTYTSSTRSFSFRQLTGASSQVELMYITPAGAIAANSTVTANAFDLAENVIVDDASIEGGDIVVAESTSSPAKWNKKYNAFKAIKSTTPYAKEVLGVISEKPGLLMRGYGLDEIDNIDEDTIRPLALSGRVPVKVSLSNGDIKIGDPITTSNISGVGMKATEAGYVIGRALEDYSSASPDGKILVLVSNSWYDPGTASEEFNDLKNQIKDQQKQIDNLKDLINSKLD